MAAGGVNEAYVTSEMDRQWSLVQSNLTNSSWQIETAAPVQNSTADSRNMPVDRGGVRWVRTPPPPQFYRKNFLKLRRYMQRLKKKFCH